MIAAVLLHIMIPLLLCKAEWCYLIQTVLGLHSEAALNRSETQLDNLEKYTLKQQAATVISSQLTLREQSLQQQMHKLWVF